MNDDTLGNIVAIGLFIVAVVVLLVALLIGIKIMPLELGAIIMFTTFLIWAGLGFYWIKDAECYD